MCVRNFSAVLERRHGRTSSSLRMIGGARTKIHRGNRSGYLWTWSPNPLQSEASTPKENDFILLSLFRLRMQYDPTRGYCGDGESNLSTTARDGVRSPHFTPTTREVSHHDRQCSTTPCEDNGGRAGMTRYHLLTPSSVLTCPQPLRLPCLQKSAGFHQKEKT